MNAQLTPAANLAGRRILPDAGTGPEPSGFQALLASASQDVPGGEGAPAAAAAGAGESSAPVEADRMGKKTTPGSECGGDAGEVLCALAAALVRPALVVTVAATPGLDTGRAEVEPCAVVGDPSQSAGGGSRELQVGEGNLAAAGTTTAAGETAFGNLPGASVPSAVDIFGAAAEIANDKTTKSAVAEDLPQPKTERPRTVDGSLGRAVQAVGDDASSTVDFRERPSGAEPVAAPIPASTIASYGNGSSVSEGVPASLTTQVTAVIEGGAAAAASPAQPVADAAPVADQTGTKKIAGRAQVPVGAAGGKAAADERSPVRFAVDSAAQTSDRQGRGRSFEPAEDTASDGEELSAAVQNASLPSAVPATSQAVAPPAPQAPSPSPPALEHTARPDAARAEIHAAPAPPPLQTAQVLQRVDKAEIRIGLQSADFGAIRLHTTVANDQVGAAVSTSHAGLRDALLVEAPSLERAIARHSLRLDSVNLDGGGGASNSPTNSFGSNERQQSPAAPANGSASTWAPARAGRPQSAVTPATAMGGGSYRLDVRA